MNEESIASEKIDTLQRSLDKKLKELEIARHELEKFTYSVSHDLRAPLRAIEGFSKILLEDYSGKLDDEGQHYLRILDTSSRKMTRMLDDLLQLSRLGRQEMRPSRVDMRALVDSVWHELHSKTKDRVIDLSVEPLPEAWGDASLLRVVWQNLIANAVKFTAPRKKAVIEISATDGPEQTIYRIKDNGVGFNMKVVGKLFGVFQRLHSDSEFDGSGMGLAVVQRLVRRHSGEVGAEGEKDKGATFWFSLPRAENQPAES